MKKCKPIPPKKVEAKANLFLRGISQETKIKFQKRAKSLGYKQYEYFDLIIKG